MTRTLEILDALIGHDTVSANSNLGLIDFVQSFLIEHGFDVHRIPDETGKKAGIFASLGPAGKGVLLSGHSDVVPVTGQNWTRDPFRLTQEGKRVYGRGTTDMKGYVASALALAERASKMTLSEPLKIALSYDEETGCIGIRDMIGALEQTIGLPRACFVGEPTEMQVAIGHKGKAALRATYIPYSTLHVGKLSGGTALNIVPDYAEMIFEYRHLAADDPDQLLARIEGAAKQVEAAQRSSEPPPRIEVERYNAYPGLDVPEDAQIVELAKRLSHSNHVTKVAFGTEAGYFDALGIPTLVCGPGSMEGQGHKADEYIELDQLAKCDAMMDRLLGEISADPR